MNKSIKIAAVAVFIVSSFSSCATIVAGGNPTITIDGEVKEPVTIITEKATYSDVELPYQVIVNRHHIDGQRVKVKSENFHFRDIVLEKATNSWAFGNILLGGIIGLGVDLITNCVSKPSKANYFIEGKAKEKNEE